MVCHVLILVFVSLSLCAASHINTLYSDTSTHQDVKKGVNCVIEMMQAHLADGEVQFAAFGILSVFSPTGMTLPYSTYLSTCLRFFLRLHEGRDNADNCYCD